MGSGLGALGYERLKGSVFAPYFLGYLNFGVGNAELDDLDVPTFSKVREREREKAAPVS